MISSLINMGPACLSIGLRAPCTHLSLQEQPQNLRRQLSGAIYDMLYDIPKMEDFLVLSASGAAAVGMVWVAGWCWQAAGT